MKVGKDCASLPPYIGNVPASIAISATGIRLGYHATTGFPSSATNRNVITAGNLEALSPNLTTWNDFLSLSCLTW